MAPNKFEKHIKKELQGRKIRPSENAWSRISEQLEISEDPKSTSFFRYGIAAGVIGLLVISIWYFNTDEPIASPQTVVTKKPVTPAEKEQNAQRVLKEKIPEDQTVATREIELKKTISNPPVKKLDEAIETTVFNTSKNDRLVEKVSITSKVSEEIIDTKVAEIIAQVDLLEKENTFVTDTEIDVLLRKAEREVLENKIFLKNNSVDAMALLADVEDELDTSFRDQIFNALKDGFVKVRTAVADRNK